MNALDRCDRCSAAAMVRFTLLSGELFFCGHHAKEFGPSLKKAALTIEDPESILHPAMVTV
jgi:hypothetical protein